MASSPSTSRRSWKHDVFLSFRGADTRNTFTGHLYQALNAKGVDTFIDDKLQRGNEISPALLQAIEDSRISIVVFSENYASSPYCLDELVLILRVKRSKRQIVLPIFYNVDPSDVEEQSGKFGDQFHTLISTSITDKEDNWRMAMAEAANLSGWHLDKGHEAKTIQEIVEKVLTRLKRTFLHVADYPTGLDFHIQEMSSMLSIESDDVRMVGICGFGGIGKTTIAKAIYNRIAHQFEGSCFLANVREMSKHYTVAQLQETLLFEILGDNRVLMGNFHLGINIVRERLSKKKVILVIDDVDNVDQLRKLAGDLDWFGRGSRIIITTRDEHLLAVHGVERVHKVQELCPDDALQLFCWNAFKKSQPMESYVELSRDVVKYAKGLPLALVVLGSFLYGRDVCEWESQLSRLRRIPNKEVYEVLKISYDSLEDNEKAIFLDIACFFRGVDKDYAVKVLYACDLDPVIGLKILTEKSLISIENNRLELHDLLQSMGRQVVHSESPTIPSRRSRLWFHEDVLSTIAENMGTDNIEGVMLDSSEPVEIHLTAETFMKMKRLRILVIRNALPTGGPINLPNQLRCLEWPGCTLTSFPSTFHARKLVALNMHNSSIKHFEGFKNYNFLKIMDLRHCELLTTTPDFSTIPHLECLNLEGCTNLVDVHQSVGCLDRLQFLSLDFCSNLRSLPNCLDLRSLDTLLLTACEKLEAFPDIGEKTTRLERLSLSRSAIKVLPSSIVNIVRLQVLNLTNCKYLSSLPRSMYMLKYLQRLLVEGCSELGTFPVCSWSELFPCSFLQNWFPSGFPMLKCLHLRSCKLLEVNFLKAYYCFTMLEELDLSRNSFVNVPDIQKLVNLRRLILSDCKELKEIMNSPRRLKRIEAKNCKSLERISPSSWSNIRDIDFSNCHKLGESLSKFLDNALISKESRNRRMEMFFPGNKVPEWFRYSSEKGSLSLGIPFHIFEQMEALAICAILSPEAGVVANLSCEVFIDGKLLLSFSRQFFSLESDHVLFSYQPCRYNRSLHPQLNDPVQFGISLEVLGAPTRSSPKKWGVYLIGKKGAIVDGSCASQSAGRSISYHSKSSSLDLMRSYCNNGLEFSFDANMKSGVTAELQQNPQRPVSLELIDISETEILAEHQQDPPLLSLSLKPTNQYEREDLVATLQHVEHPWKHDLLLSLLPRNDENDGSCAGQNAGRSISYHSKSSSLDLMRSYCNNELEFSFDANMKRGVTAELQPNPQRPVSLELIDISETEILAEHQQDPPLLSLSLKPTNQYEREDLVATLQHVEHPWKHDLSLSLLPRNDENDENDGSCARQSAGRSISYHSKSSSLDLMRSYCNNGLEFSFDANMKRGVTDCNNGSSVSLELIDISERNLG